ncbi:MAG: T9SS type A sorting domain-containing protein [Saprospiraceae bacterium]
MEKILQFTTAARFFASTRSLVCLCFLVGYANLSVAQCGFDVKMEVSNLYLQANLSQISAANTTTVNSAFWYIQSTGQVLGDGPQLEYTFPNYGECTLCVSFESTLEDDSECNAAICQTLLLEAYSSICLDPSLITVGEPCDGTEDPVCACNGFSYFNACEAEYWGGAISFDAGTCTVDCSVADCVRPGDTNKDATVDLLDMLNLGMGFGKKGPRRPYATTAHDAQAAPDWLQNTSSGINYKHFDGNGDGIINQADLQAIATNYTPMDMPAEDLQTEEGPLLHIVFSRDTIEIDGNTPNQIEVSANIMLGDSELSVADFYGAALYLSYPGDLVTQAGVSYSNGSFAGAADDMMFYRQDVNSRSQLDIAMTRMNHSSVAGFGRIAALNFIVESDIIDGRSEKYVNFPLSVKGLKVVNSFGEEIKTRISEKPATLTFSVLTTSTFEPSLGDQVAIYPNPVSEVLNIDLGELAGERLSVYNALGQLVLTKNISSDQETLPVNDLEKGVYWLNIHTTEGIAVKRVIVE